MEAATWLLGPSAGRARALCCAALGQPAAPNPHLAAMHSPTHHAVPRLTAALPPAVCRDAIALHNTPRCSLGGPAPLSEFPQVVAGAGDSSGSGEDGSGPSFSGSVDVPEGVAGTGCGGCSENGNGANGNGNGAHGSLPPPIIAGPFDGDALMA